MKQKEKWAKEACDNAPGGITKEPSHAIIFLQAWTQGFEFAREKTSELVKEDYDQGDRSSHFEVLDIGEEEVP